MSKKYLVIEEYNTIEEKCSNCKTAGIMHKYFDYSFEVAEEIMNINRVADVKILGMYKLIDSLIIDCNADKKEIIKD